LRPGLTSHLRPSCSVFLGQQMTDTAVEAQTHQLQGEVMGVKVAPRTVEFNGQQFRIAEKVGLMPLMRFAHASAQDLDTSDMEALAAIYDMLQDCIDPGVEPCGKCPQCEDPDGVCPQFRKSDWRRFEQHAIATKADADELLPVVTRVIEILTARPTPGPSGSSAGSAPTSPKSMATYSATPDAASMLSPTGSFATPPSPG